MFAAVLLACVPACAQAQEAPPDDDAARIPAAGTERAGPTEANGGGGIVKAGRDANGVCVSSRVGLELATSVAQGRDSTEPGANGSDQHQSRAAVDAVLESRLSASWSTTLSDRVVVQSDAMGGGSSKTSMANDLREAYLGWIGPDSTYVDAGRVNVRSGTALGWNPTDYFKAGSSIAMASADPSAARANRLGTVMVHLQRLWSHASFGLALAPKLHAQGSLLDQADSGISPRFERTNYSERYLATVSFDAADLNPQLLLFGKRGSYSIGASMSKPIGAGVIAYAEWSGARERGLASRAYEFGRASGDLPAMLQPLPIDDARRHFYNDTAIGASAVIANRLTLNLEYHYHGSGLSGSQLRDAFAASAEAPRTLGPEFWYLRAYALDRQEPVAREQIFMRVAVNDLFVKGLSASAFAFHNAHDGSIYAQLSATYDLSDAYSISFYAGKASGGQSTEYGSLPISSTAALQLNHYF
jgi:hypothetical protein